MANVMKYLLGPRLFRMYKTQIQESKTYVANPVESIGDMVVKWVRFCWSFSYWGSPIVLPILYRRGFFTAEGLVSLTSYGGTVSIMLVLAIFVRALGRYSNADYVKFIEVLTAAQKNYNPVNKKLLEKYDFEFSAWPVDYDIKKKGTTKGIDNNKATFNNAGNTLVDRLKCFPFHCISFIAAHTFGIRMVYPGQTSIINALVGQPLQDARAKLVEEKDGKRSKVKTEDGNEIDTMFIDRRNNQKFPNGNVLVVCCEGNSGFYEIGCTTTPLEAGYSVLGWNHPGFAGSSGNPYPQNEKCAIDGVMQYAINTLGFKAHDIALFAWSIGGYAASYASMIYPDIRFVILDATFDDIFPLAVSRMPKSLESIVELAIRNYINLNIADQLIKFPGPILLIRRSKDEMITTQDPTVIASNRGNDLLMKILQYRYPMIVDSEASPIVRGYLSRTSTERQVYLTQHGVDHQHCESILKSYVEENSCSYPMQLGASERELKNELALYLAYQYMHDFDATHCIPLPASFFKKPWTL